MRTNRPQPCPRDGYHTEEASPSAQISKTRALTAFGSGETAVILAPPRCRKAWQKMADMGLLPGEEVTVVLNAGHGPLLLAVTTSRFMLGRKMAATIMAAPAPVAAVKA